MANTLRFKRGLESARTGFTPASGEPIFTTDQGKLYIGDGSTLAQNLTAIGNGNVSNTGTPVDGQIAIWTDATTVEGDAQFTFDTSTNTLAIGADDSASSVLRLYGDAGNVGGELRVYTGATADTDTFYYELKPANNTTGDLVLTSKATVDGTVFTVDAATDVVDFAQTPSVGGTNVTVVGHAHSTLTWGTGIAGTNYDGTGAVTADLDFTELTDMTAGISGTTEFILNDAGTESRKAASEIGLQNFDNATSAFITSAGVTYENLNSNGDIETDVSNDTASTVPSTQAVKSYVDAVATSEMTYKGGYDASTNTPNLDDTGKITTAAGDMYTVTNAGTFFTTAVEAGDVLIAEIASANVEADWTIVQKNLDGAVLDTRSINTNANSGLAGGGNLTADRSLTLDVDNLTVSADTPDVDGAADYVPIYNTSATATHKVLVNEFLDGGTF